MSAGPPLGRRAVLLAGAGAAGLAALGLASCSVSGSGAAVPSTPRSTPPPGPDEPAVTRARAAASALLSTASDLRALRPDLAALLDSVVADHRAHLAALAPAGAPAPLASASRPSPSPSRPGRGAADSAVRDLVTAETAAAQTALDDVADVAPGLAALLARIAAARATHADLLASAAHLRVPGPLRTAAAAPAVAPGVPPATARSVTASAAAPLPGVVAPPSPPSPTSSPQTTPDGAPGATGPAVVGLSTDGLGALTALTAGEHAAVYAYGAIVARVSAQQRALARDAWSWHQARRDVLEERLLTAGARPPAAASAYDLGDVGSASAAASLAATVEDRLVALAVRAVATTTGADRGAVAEAVVAGARRAAGWRGRGTALPG